MTDPKPSAKPAVDTQAVAQQMLAQLAQSPMVAAEKWNQQMILWVDQLSSLMLNEAKHRGVDRAWVRLSTRDGGGYTVASFMPFHPAGFLAIAPVPDKDTIEALTGPDGKVYTPTVKLLSFDSIASIDFGFTDHKPDRALGFASVHNYQPHHQELATLHLGEALQRLNDQQNETAKEAQVEKSKPDARPASSSAKN